MPAGKEKTDNPAQRTTFRPPWVKEGNNPAPTPAPAPWTKNKTVRRDSSTSSDNSSTDYNPLAEVQLRKIKQKDSIDDFEDLPTKKNAIAEVQLRKTVVKQKERPPEEEGGKKNKILASVQLRKTSIKEKEPQENGAKESFFQKPALKHVPQKEKSPPKKDHKIHNLPTLKKGSERVLKSPPRKPSIYRDDTLTSSEEETEEEEEEEEAEIDKEVPKKRNALVREASMRKLSQSNVPLPPPQPGMPPPPPMMPGEMPKKKLNTKQKARLDKLRARPKVRPDWNNLLQEIESKKKLKHVVCNDRSSPLLPEAKTEDEHFLYKSEEPNVHNELLKQIEGGIKLKKVKTNDRSRPMLDGLRKFRRQMTIEEQIQKSMSMASIPPEEITPDEIDEMDDIDKVRDDLQSTKQMLAVEMRNKENQERENKRLLSRIQNLEAELEKERSKNKDGGGGGGGSSAADDKVLKSLRKEVEEARKTGNDLEKKYNQVAEELDAAKAQAEEFKRHNQMLEKKLQESLQGKRLSLADRKHSTTKDDSDEEFEEEPEEESDGEDTPEKREKKALKEVKQLAKKLQNFKNKEDTARKERIALRDIIKKNQTAIKEEKKKYKQLKKEVDKMAALMKDVEEEEDEDAKEKDDMEEEETIEEESSEEEETESESEESESEVSQSEDEDAPVENKKSNLSSRVKRHENRLNALKKANFLLKTNAERLQDDLNNQKVLTASLQEDLDSVLSELG